MNIIEVYINYREQVAQLAMDTDFYKHNGIMTPKLILLKLTVESLKHTYS
jgi:hypothetical protein